MHVRDIEEAAPLRGRFPRKCQICHEEITPGDLAVKISSVGPKGGKHFRHNGCPLTGAMENPFMNAGRRLRGVLGGETGANVYKQGKKRGQSRLPALPKAESCDLSAMSVGTYDKATKSFSGGLVGKAQSGDSSAVAELSRRGRDADGFKMAWKKKAPGVRKAANNPFGF